MTTAERNVRAQCKIEKPDKHGYRWFTVAGRQHTNSARMTDLKQSIETHVYYRLKRIREAAQLLREVGFKVVPPPKG